MTSELKALTTRYNGYRFRSRLEARWAVFFDALGIEYEYEKEGYDLGKAGYYLPDFWLPQVNMWAEVKGVDFTEVEWKKCVALVEATGDPCILLVGEPSARLYACYKELPVTAGVCVDHWGHSLINVHISTHIRSDWGEYPSDDEMRAQTSAINAARSARFEFGESG